MRIVVLNDHSNLEVHLTVDHDMLPTRTAIDIGRIMTANSIGG